MRIVALVATALAAAAAASRAGPPADTSTALVSGYGELLIHTPPPSLGLDPFYGKYLDAGGIPVISSPKVPDAALLIARDIVDAELMMRPDVRRELIRMGARVGVMAIDEGTLDIPEQRDWKKPAEDDERLTACERKHYERIRAMTDAQYWNERARGMGGTYTTGAAENLLGVPGTRYFGENILVHEFSHNILSAIQRVDPALHGRVRRAYQHARTTGLWQGDYASVTVQEYWAEGTQFWFNSNMQFSSDGATVLNDADLEKYDPMLYSVLEEVYGPVHHISADVFYMHPARVPQKPQDAHPHSSDC